MITIKARSKSKKSTRRSSKRRRPQSRFDIVKFWVRRITVIGVCASLLIWAGAALWMSGKIQDASRWSKDQFITASADLGMRVENIYVEGRIHSDGDLLLGLLNIEQGDPLMRFNPQEAKALISEITWVDKVRIARRFPDTISIHLQEKIPVAIWKHEGKRIVIDRRGDLITGEGLDRFSALPTITGAAAPERLDALLVQLEAYPELYARVAEAAWVGSRRWDLRLQNGIALKIPSENEALAFSLLMRADQKDGVLSKDLRGIDLREAGRLIIHTRPGAVRDYQVNYNSEEQGV